MTPHDFSSVVTGYRQVANLPVVVQANAGSPELLDGVAVYRLSPPDFAAGMREVVDAGASIVGGCCGTTPAHIAELRRQLSGEILQRRT
ncbi:MAG: hypothetical protein EHM13_08515 [Acidobacteria bacterium]|nr:MAG: hypothetical protein EHM13_08515 [Acidobacteriota bacterium]